MIPANHASIAVRDVVTITQRASDAIWITRFRINRAHDYRARPDAVNDRRK